MNIRSVGLVHWLAHKLNWNRVRLEVYRSEVTGKVYLMTECLKCGFKTFFILGCFSSCVSTAQVVYNELVECKLPGSVVRWGSGCYVRVHTVTSSPRSRYTISRPHLEFARTSSDLGDAATPPCGVARSTARAIGLPLVMTRKGPSPGTSAVVVASGERRSRWEGL